MDKRVYGVLGISSIMANWNADFTGYPKSTQNGDVYGSDKALKYPMKKMWNDEGKKVLYIKSMKFSADGSLVPKTLKERYEEIFRDGSKDSEKDSEAKNSTLGTKITSDEAHYFYPFVINPMAYKEFVQLGVTDGYTEEDYQNFKRTALVSATSYATNAKEGCENEFALFVETESDMYLPNLTEYITFEKGDKLNTIDISEVASIINAVKDRVKSVEVYYNPYTTNLVSGIEDEKVFNIITLKEV